MIILKRRERFCASHCLFNPNWDDTKNLTIYGKCSSKNGHGHNYVLDVAIRGSIDPETGMVFDLVLLKSILKQEVLNDIDHKHLNFDVEWLQGKIPTTEILVENIWQRLEKKINEVNSKVQLYSVTVWETEKNFVTKILENS